MRCRTDSRQWISLFSTAVLLLVINLNGVILANDVPEINRVQREGTALTLGDLSVVVLSESNPASILLALHNTGLSDVADLRCIVRFDSGLHRVARGDSLLLKPTKQHNKYKFVVKHLASGATKRFQFPVLVADEKRRKAVFAIQYGSNWHSTGIGISANAKKPLPAVDENWGVLTGSIVFDGEPPAPGKIRVIRHQEIFGVHLPDESLIVNDQNQGISNVVVKLFVPRGENLPEVHAGLKNPRPALLQIANGQFVPHVTLLQTNQVLTVLNRDDHAYNFKLDTLRNPPANPILKAGANFVCRFGRAERLPTPISGSIHPGLNGKIVVSDHPYVAKTDRNGRFEIRNLPPGRHLFQVWHERCGYVTDVINDQIPEFFPKAVFAVEIKKGANDIGEILAAANQFD